MSRRAAGAALVAVCALSGCARTSSNVAGPDPSAAPSAAPSSASPSPVVGIPVPSTVPTVGTSPSFSELTAVSCGGQPSAARIIAILRDQHMIGRHDTVSVQVGPLCAGTWQYTVVTQSGREPLQVVTRNVADQLQLVTAGTDVCTITVTTEAPTGIRAITHC